MYATSVVEGGVLAFESSTGHVVTFFEFNSERFKPTKGARTTKKP